MTESVLPDRKSSRLAPTQPINRRGLILRSAANSFAELGFSGTSLEDICAGAGIAKPTLYHHFRSKAAILYEVLEDYTEALIAALQAPEREALEPAERLLEFMKDMVASLDTRRGQVRCFYDNAMEFLPPEERDHLRMRREFYAGHLKEILRLGRISGAFNFDDEDMVSAAIFGMCGWAYNWYDPDGPSTSEQIATRLWRVILAGIDGESTRQAMPSPSES